MRSRGEATQQLKELSLQLGEDDGAQGDGVERNEGLEIESRPAESHLRKQEKRRCWHGGRRKVGEEGASRSQKETEERKTRLR